MSFKTAPQASVLETRLRRGFSFCAKPTYDTPKIKKAQRFTAFELLRGHATDISQRQNVPSGTSTETRTQICPLGGDGSIQLNYGRNQLE